MEKIKNKNIITLIVSVAMAFTMFPAFASADVSPVTAKVWFNASDAERFIMSRQELTVSSDLSNEYYGIREQENGVTVIDVLIAACIKKYGNAFKNASIEERKEDYLDFSYSEAYDSWSVTKWFGQSTFSTIYYINKSMSGSVDQSVVSNGDLIESVYIGESFSDLYSCFDKNSYSAKTGRKFRLTIKADTWGTAVRPNTGTRLCSVDKSTGLLTVLPGMTTDAEGIALISFNKPGTYYISAKGSVTYDNFGSTVTGNITAPWAEVKVTMDAPSVKAVNRSASSIKISWTKIVGAEKYRVYRSVKKNKGFKKVKTTRKTTWINNKLKTGKKYYYKVRAISGNEKSPFSKVKSSVPKPAKAVIKKIQNRGGNILISWKKVKDADGYVVYKKEGSKGKFRNVKTLKASYSKQYKSMGIKKGKVYSYKIKAYKILKGKKVYGDFSEIKKIKVK